MARKRLQPADPAEMFRTRNQPAELEAKALFRLSPQPPIAHVAAEASAAAALAEVTRGLADMREAGILVLTLPLAAIRPDHLLRDRIFTDADDMAALKQSIRAHGQRQPVDICALPGVAPSGQDSAAPWGLISGWRRLQALKELHDETGDESFASVKALVRRPENAGAAYAAMVEENEIRANLSHYERARIVALAVESGVFDSERAGLQALFGHVSRAKRSKIGSFITVWRALDPYLRFPAAISERLGLRLAERIGKGFAITLQETLKRAGAATPAAEQAVLERVLSRRAPRQPETIAVLPGVEIEVRRHGSRMRLLVSGDMVDDRLLARIGKAIRG